MRLTSSGSIITAPHTAVIAEGERGAIVAWQGQMDLRNLSTAAPYWSGAAIPELGPRGRGQPHAFHRRSPARSHRRVRRRALPGAFVLSTRCFQLGAPPPCSQYGTRVPPAPRPRELERPCPRNIRSFSAAWDCGQLTTKKFAQMLSWSRHPHLISSSGSLKPIQLANSPARWPSTTPLSSDQAKTLLVPCALSDPADSRQPS